MSSKNEMNIVEADAVKVGHTEHDHEHEKTPSQPPDRKIIHKIDRRLLIVTGLMQAVSFIDRSNVSNAAVAGMTADLKLGVGNRYSIILLVFFAPYVAFQFPASVLVRKVGPRMFLSSIVLCWGVVMLGFGFVKNWQSLIPLRAIVGAFEAGCFPDDLFSRTSVFYLLGVLGSALTGVLGLAFSKMDGLGGLGGWRWIFVMEGIITILIATASFIFREGAFVIRRLNRDRQDAEPESFTLGRFLRPALDLKIWGFAMLFYCTTLQAYAVGFLLPVILATGLGYSAAAAQGLSTPPYLAAMLLMFVEGLVSDRFRLRFPVLYFNAALTVTGLCCLVWAKQPGVQYMGAVFATMGSSANLPTVMVSRDAPEYLPGIYCCMPANGVILLVTTALVLHFVRRNRQADQGLRVIENLPYFRYAI
ncbi:hypothetical protein SCUCBS95973_001179 [Sporothrix curviconia]|uniref:Major facilitator superfamily (MFS) profile domain-containing protein n=1 Tax=Sporothrix curviconia TaxID=1260050 RepID=A0ABP0AWJ1_9PEZI